MLSFIPTVQRKRILKGPSQTMSTTLLKQEWSFKLSPNHGGGPLSKPGSMMGWVGYGELDLTKVLSSLVLASSQHTLYTQSLVTSWSLLVIEQIKALTCPQCLKRRPFYLGIYLLQASFKFYLHSKRDALSWLLLGLCRKWDFCCLGREAWLPETAQPEPGEKLQNISWAVPLIWRKCLFLLSTQPSAASQGSKGCSNQTYY